MKIDIISGFLGAGKTTLIKKLVAEAYRGEKVVLIENEFGEIGVDGGFLKDAGIEITEMNSGCICCSLVGDFSKALQEVESKFSPDRIVIEPSGVGKLSDVIRAVENAGLAHARLNAFCTVVDANKCKTYLKNFGEFFLDQVEHAGCIVLSHTSDPQKTQHAVALLREHTPSLIVTTDWNELSGKDLLAAMERSDTLDAEMEKLAHEHEEHCCHDRRHEHGEHCHHDHEHEHGEHCHHDHEHGQGEHCCHDHEHHHHHADEVFQSWGRETAKFFKQEEISSALAALESGEYGDILRAKGIVNAGNEWIYFDYVPREPDLRTGAPAVTGRLCVIGCGLNEEKLAALFGL